MNWKEVLKPNAQKILLMLVLPYAFFVVLFQLIMKPNSMVVHFIGETVFSNNERINVLFKSIVFASVYSAPNWIWSYPFGSYIAWKRGKKK